MDDLPISMAIHFFYASLKKDLKMQDAISKKVSNMDSDDVYLFIKGVGAALIGMVKGQEKIEPTMSDFFKRVCDKLKTGDYS